MLLKVSTAVNVVVFMADSTDQITGKTGLTLTITSSKAAAAFGSITPTVTELTNGFYKLELTSGHTDTLGDFWLYITATGAIPTVIQYQVVTDLPGDTVASVTGITSDFKQNTLLNNFSFPMYDSSGSPATGLTVTVQVSIDGASFSNATNTPATEVASGLYKINLSAADLNGSIITFKFSAPGALTQFYTIRTQT